MRNEMDTSDSLKRVRAAKKLVEEKMAREASDSTDEENTEPEIKPVPVAPVNPPPPKKKNGNTAVLINDDKKNKKFIR